MIFLFRQRIYLTSQLLLLCQQKQLGAWDGKGRFIGTLPVSGHSVYAFVECDSMTGHGDITVCCNNALASNSISTLLKQVLSNGK